MCGYTIILAQSLQRRYKDCVNGKRRTNGNLLWQRPGFLVRRLHQIHSAMFEAYINYSVQAAIGN